MNASFGIDHPLIAVRDIERVRQNLIALGFTMTAIGKHPWGTSTSLAMFNGCLIEIMGIYDDRLLDEKPAGDFRFGRHVHRYLQEREGVALTALHSTDIVADVASAQKAGLTVAGQLEFGRDVTLPDGRKDRTKTTLALMPDAIFPRLSLFLCQQHRPELIYVQEWLDHPNTVNGIYGVTICAHNPDHQRLRLQLERLYGAAKDSVGGFSLKAVHGTISVLTPEAIEASIGVLAPEVLSTKTPAIVGMDFTCKDAAILEAWIEKSGFDWRKTNNAIVLTQAEMFGNTFLQFNLTAH